MMKEIIDSMDSNPIKVSYNANTNRTWDLKLL